MGSVPQFGPAAAALVDGPLLAPVLAAVAVALCVDTAPGGAQAATRMVATARTVRRAAGTTALARWNPTVTMNAPPRCCPYRLPSHSRTLIHGPPSEAPWLRGPQVPASICRWEAARTAGRSQP